MTKDKKVIEWISSLSGFQGGNPNAALWFCGLEYQGVNIDEEIKEPFWSVDNPPFLIPEENKHPDHCNEKFNQNIVKLANAFYGSTVPEIKVEEAFLQEGNIFKLNLYPLPQKRTGEAYSKEIYDKTGIITKSELRSICLDNGLDKVESRFENFKNLFNKHTETVKAVVCCSTGAMDNFVLAFAGEKNFYELRKDMLNRVENTIESTKSKNKKYYYWCKIGKTYLFVIPFLGRFPSNLKDDEELKFMGEKIHDISV